MFLSSASLRCFRFVLRDRDAPYANIENTGITMKRVEAMEKQLKRDVLAEAGTSNSRMLLNDEDDTGNLVGDWEPIDGPTSVLTAREAFNLAIDVVTQQHAEAMQERQEQLMRLQHHGNQLTSSSSLLSSPAAAAPSPSSSSLTYSFPMSNGASVRIDYHRTPITDEQAPSPEIVDAIIGYLEQAAAEPKGKLLIVVNCQMGRGRTTTGMIISAMWCAVRNKFTTRLADADVVAAPELLEAVQLKQEQARAGAGAGAAGAGAGAPTSASLASPDPASSAAAAAEREAAHRRALSKGWYSIVRSLVRVLKDGAKVKEETDMLIDRCAAMQNLREVVLQTQLLAESALPRKKPYFVKKGQNFLIRYFYLICINAYIRSNHQDKFKTPFVEWLRDRKEILNILSSIEFPQLVDTHVTAPMV